MKFPKITNLIYILIIIFTLNCNSDRMKILFNESAPTMREWIRISYNNFEDGNSDGWEDNTGTPSPVDIPAECASALSNMLGPFANPASEPNKETMKIFDLSAHPHSEVLMIFDLVIMESWDKELAIVEIDDVEEFSASYHFNEAPETDYCKTNEGTVTFNDFGPQRIEIQVPHTGSQLKIHFRSTLDQVDPSGAPTDEWFGVDNISIYVR